MTTDDKDVADVKTTDTEKKKRGRPKKADAEKKTTPKKDGETPKGKRGRPPKADKAEEKKPAKKAKTEDNGDSGEKKKRGRPKMTEEEKAAAKEEREKKAQKKAAPKEKKAAPKEKKDGEAPKKRGRKPKAAKGDDDKMILGSATSTPSDALLYYNIVTTARSPFKRKIKARDYVSAADSCDDEEDEEFTPEDEIIE